MMKEEAWIWVELLAFDQTQKDFGVGEYLERIGFVPTGISFLFSSIDFIILHNSMGSEYELFPDVCSRRGHEGNEERKRQKWTNFQLRGLINELHKYNIKLFCSIFIYYMNNQFHREWASDHLEIILGDKIHGSNNAISMLARLNDGTLFEDFFVAKLIEVVQDYNFDGWHGPDGQGPGWSLTHSDCSDEFVFQFAEYLGKDRIEHKYLQRMNDSQEKMNQRLEYIWKNFNREWADFTSERWLTLWSKATNAMHKLNKEVMINSPFAKSVFESIFYFGLDYRKLSKIGVDYLLVESVSTSLALINGEYERVFDHCGTLAELKASLPGIKLIVMPGVKDVVESYDSLRHAPARLERDFYMLANQTYIYNNSLERCGDGYMVCLGDGITQYEWAFLRNICQTAFSFEPVECGEMIWLSGQCQFDPLREDHKKNGTWPPYQYVSHLVEKYAFDISSVCTCGELDKLHRPLLVPGFDLFTDEIKDKILDISNELVVLIGNFHAQSIPANSQGVFCQINNEYNLGCVVLNGKTHFERKNLSHLKDNYNFDWSEYNGFVKNRCPRMSIPESFWKEAARLIRANLPISNLRNPQDNVHVMTMKNAQLMEQVALLSGAETYKKVQYYFKSEKPYLKKISSFPYSKLQVNGHSLSFNDFHSPLHIPPFGIVVFETQPVK